MVPVSDVYILRWNYYTPLETNRVYLYIERKILSKPMPTPNKNFVDIIMYVGYNWSKSSMHIFGGDRYHTISPLKQTMWTQTNQENGRSAEGNDIGLLHR